jgi:TPR repeat protein
LALYDDYAARCSAGDPRACSTVAYLDYQRLGRRNDQDEAIASLEATCERGDGWGCQLAGGILLQRLDPDAPSDEARGTVAAMLRRGCELGDPDACRQLTESGLESVGVQTP